MSSPRVVVVGGANIDLKSRSAAAAVAGTSNPGHSSISPGGVGRNIAENIARLGTAVDLISVVGSDPLGMIVLDHTAAAGVGVEHVLRTDQRTGTYSAVLDADGELIVAISDMGATAGLGPEQLRGVGDVISSADLLVLDGNLTAEAMHAALELANGARTIVEPVSVPKAEGLAAALDRRVYAVTPNRGELAALTGSAVSTDGDIETAANVLLSRGIDLVWVRLGERGSMLCSADAVVEIPAVATEVEDVTGAGDAMLGAFCHALLAGSTIEDAALFSHAAAALTIASPHTVRPDLTPQLVDAVLDA